MRLDPLRLLRLSPAQRIGLKAAVATVRHWQPPPGSGLKAFLYDAAAAAVSLYEDEVSAAVVLAGRHVQPRLLHLAVRLGPLPRHCVAGAVVDSLTAALDSAAADFLAAAAAGYHP